MHHKKNKRTTLSHSFCGEIIMNETRSCLPRFRYLSRLSKQNKSTDADSELFKLMMQGSWSRVCRTITYTNAFATSSSFLACIHCKKSHSPLFLACTLNPPVKVIVSLLEANPFAAFEIDCEGNLPLHLACAYGASPEVIRELLRTNAKAVWKKDINGMLPIHKTCQSYFKNIDQSIPRQEAQKFLMEVLRDLLITDPTTIHEEDNDGMCPIENALYSGMRMKVISTLQKASVMSSESSVVCSRCTK